MMEKIFGLMLPPGLQLVLETTQQIKFEVQPWYHSNKYQLKKSGLYCISKSYIPLISQRPATRSHDLVRSRVVFPKHRFLCGL